MVNVNKGLVILLCIAAAICDLGNCTEYTAVYDADGRRLCAVGHQPDEVRPSTNKATHECLRLCDDNPECVVFNLYDNTTCEVFTCSSKSSLGYQIVESCKSFRINDCTMRCNQPECEGQTTHAKDTTSTSISSDAMSTLSVGQYEVSTEEETTFAEESKSSVDSSSATSILNIGEYEVTTEIKTSFPPPTQPPPLSDCEDVRAAGHTKSGVYLIKMGNSGNEASVYCDMNNSESWLVFQRRLDGSVDFERNWIDYTDGFGNITGEFWLGNEILYNLLASRNYRLRVEIEAWNGDRRYAEYSTFFIASSSDNYTLTISGFSGDAGDSLSPHNGSQFSTSDVDNDDETENLAQFFRGGWWHDSFGSSYSRLNGMYLHVDGGEAADFFGIVWYTYGYDECYSLYKTEMKLAP